MKTVIYLLLAFSLILSTSCSKESSLTPVVTPEKKITTTTTTTTTTSVAPINLVGNWNFKSLEYSGRTINAYDAEFKKTVNCVTLSFRDVTTTTLKLYTDCSILLNQGETWTSESLNYTMDKTEINVNDGTVKFEILSATSTTLKVKLTASMNSNMAIGGIYILEKK